MPKTHYDVLGVQMTSTQAEIRSAFRKIVLQHHPDRSTDPKSKPIFLAATESYEVLGDEERRKEYDAKLMLERKLRERVRIPTGGTSFGTPAAERRPPTSVRMAEIRDDVAKLSQIYSRGRYDDAVDLARDIISRDAKQAVPYAILGDIARMRGNRGEALKWYAYAAQFDAKNPVYQRRYEDLLNAPIRASGISSRDVDEVKPHYFAGYVGIGLIFVACAYLILSKEQALLPSLSLISTWTVGLVVMLFFSGVTIGACLSIEGFVDSFGAIATNSLGRVSPTLALASIAIVNFWLATLFYIILGLLRRSFSLSTTRVVAATAVGTTMLALAASASGRIDTLQVFLWGGNVAYLGTMCGWMVADALRVPG